jgi:predicted type IV restriction endonuclease
VKKIIEDLRARLESGSFEKEEHVRIGIVARICQVLGWDVWNPQEFYTEFPIKMKNREGSVDVALFHSNLKDRTPDVFFELKAVGKLKGNIESSEEQLQEYNYYNTASITVLTDGRSWRFYLSSATGTFSQKLFCSLNLLDDAADYIVKIFHDILSKDRFARDAVNCAEKMLSDLKLSREVERAKKEANIRGDEYPDLNKYQLVQLILKERGHEFGTDEIKRLWDFKSGIKPEDVTVIDKPPIQVPDKAPITTYSSSEWVIGLIDDDYTYRKINRIYVIDQWYPVKYWWEAKKVIYTRFLTELLKATLPKTMSITSNGKDFHESFTLEGGFYAEGHGSANTIIKHIKRALQAVGYDAAAVIQIEASKTKTTLRNYGN